MTILAFSYLRFSDPSQAKGDSRRRQLSWGEAFCQRHGLTLDESLNLEDLGGVLAQGRNQPLADVVLEPLEEREMNLISFFRVRRLGVVEELVRKPGEGHA